MKAKIDNKIVTVKMIDTNYNESSVEVELLEGTFQGRRAIVNKCDIIEEVKNIKDLEKLITNNIDMAELEDYNLVELIGTNIYNLTKEFSNNYKLSNREYQLLTDDIYGKYSSCNTIEDVKVNIVLDVIECRIDNNKATFTNMKKKALDVVKEAYGL